MSVFKKQTIFQGRAPFQGVQSEGFKGITHSGENRNDHATQSQDNNTGTKRSSNNYYGCNCSVAPR